MKAFIALFFLLSIIPVSLIGMIYGWGLHPVNWGWVVFSYTYLIIPSVIAGFMNDK